MSKSTLHKAAVFLAVIFGIVVATYRADAAPVVLPPADLRCEYLVNPLGIDVRCPRLSWRLISERRGEEQTAYRIIVASSPERLKKDQGDMWDSGKVESDQSIQIEYAGKPLNSEQGCWWKVQVWGKDRQPSAWSEPARWSMGLLNPQDWNAKWIGLDGGEENHPHFREGSWIWFPGGNPTVGVPGGTKYFRRTFTIPAGQEVRLATAYVLADDKFVLSVNGTKAVDGGGLPFGTETDVTRLLRPGVNVLALEVANGDESAPSPAGLMVEFKLEFTIGEPLIINTDSKWRAAQTVSADWRTVDFDDHEWEQVQVLGPAGIAPWGDVSENEHRRLPARMLRREFALTKPVARATAFVCGLGFFECYFNGRKVGDHVMDPALSRYDKRAMYMTFDVTKYLRRGDNAVGVWLGNGRFFPPRIRIPTPTKTFGYPKLLFQMRVEYTDGSVAEFVSDEQWKVTTNGPIRANSEFDGEEYDARREMAGWAKTGFNAAEWQPVKVVKPPGGALIAQMIEPIRVTEVLKPLNITNPKPGVYLVDFGQNLYGVVRLKVHGPAGTQVRLRTSFSKSPDGNIKMEDNRSARSTDVYILSGHGKEVWSPRFRGQGTRYAEVTGFPGVPKADNFEMLVVHTDFDRVGEFVCSDELLNHVYANVVRSARMQNRSVPMEPDRDERQGWLGHPAKTSESEAYIFNVAPFYSSFMGEIRIDQRADGNISDAGSIWPFYSGDVIWPSVVAILPDWFNNFYADRRILETNWETMNRWMQFQQKTNLQTDFTFNAGPYGDWVDAATMDGLVSEHGATSRPLMSTAYFYYDCRRLERAARLLDKVEEAREYAKLADNVRTSFLKRFFDPVTKTFESRTQCSYILPLAFGLVPTEYRATVVSNLVEEVMVKSRGHLSVGLIGMQWFMQVLTDVGHPEVAYTVATRTTRPSWGYMISRGGTSMWERWDQDTRDPGMNGESQMILAGNLGAWFYQTLGGINYDSEQPAFKHIILHPRPVGDLTFVKATHRSLYGPIVSEWHIKNDKFHWKVVVPPNTTASVYVPAKDAASVREAGKPAAQSPGVKFVRAEPDDVVYELGAGSYEFVSDDFRRPEKH